MLSDLCIIGFTYLFMTSFEHSLHKVSHDPLSGPLYRWHKIHHKDYPPTRLESEIFINTSGSIFYNYYLYCILSSWFIFYCVSSNRVFTIMITEASIYTLIINYFHECYHTQYTIWNRFQWYQSWKLDHLYHHKKQMYNFNLIDSFCDKVNHRYLSIASNDSHTPSN